jgi:predicted nucleotidyltransferase component of viral defense system
MIREQELRRIAKERKLALDLVEKDYALGWILYGIVKSSLAGDVVFKGGTALSKSYFPGQWRLSEDLDFTLCTNRSWDDVISKIENLPSKLNEVGMNVTVKGRPHTNPNYIQSKFQYKGPISKNTVNLEISKEPYLGAITTVTIPRAYDYEVFDVTVYTLENILAEKMRTVLERGKIKDYYDVWRLLQLKDLNLEEVIDTFYQKCKSKGIEFKGVEQFFPKDIEIRLKQYEKVGLARLTSDPLPSLHGMLAHLRKSLVNVFEVA